MTPTRLAKLKTYFVDDGAKRGPLSMSQVRFHPTERILLAACADRHIAAWNLDDKEINVKNQTGVPGKLICPHDAGWVRCVDISPNGQWIVTGGSDRRLKLWAMNADKPSRDIEAHAGWVEAVAFSPDGSLILTGGADKDVKLWKSADFTPVKTFNGHAGFVRDVAWRPDGSAFVSGAEDGNIMVWDVPSLSLSRTIAFGGANEQFGQNPALSGVQRLHISKDGKLIAAAGSKQTTVFDLTTGSPLAQTNFDIQVCFSPTAEVIVAGSNNVRVAIYEAGKFTPAKPDKNGKLGSPGQLVGKELAQIKLGDFSVGMRFSADGKRLGLGRADGKVEVWEVA